ncbi:hypothetical protein Anas_08541 [Armadillidium nasatum]|uniref:Uncharacterized protein n=1 Tax=Armadillidium nasatum TaxID=96803 RepID=A0A5N5SM51_9CRUS|nr:hypothetical protein Anas_08541 [Armadillidium nasatum]
MSSRNLNLNSQKCLPTENLGHIIGNLAVYMECASQDGSVGLSSVLISLFDTFLRKVLSERYVHTKL